MKKTAGRIPVILDTDIGGDIDDTWALAMMLKAPELDIKLIVSATDDTVYRASIIGRLLEIAGRTDIPVGIGIKENENKGPQLPWIKDYRLASYPGTVFKDGVDAIIKTIEKSPKPITLISIGPVPNIAEVLRRAPHIASKTRFVGMHGSIYRNLNGESGAIAEYNVKKDIPACQSVFKTQWLDFVITPLDTCGLIKLKGNKYRRVTSCKDPLIKAVIENYRIWLEGKPDTESSILFDTVAVHLAYSTKFLKMKRMKLLVTDDGFTREDEKGLPMNVAIDWTDLPGYEDYLIERLLS